MENLTRLLVIKDMTAEMRNERTARKLIELINAVSLVSCIFHDTELSKVQVSVIVSNIHKVLVKDRVSYTLHNLQEIMII